MMRFLATLALGWALGIASVRLLPATLPATPVAVQKAAAAVGLPPVPASAAPSGAVTGPLAASILAETKKDYDAALREVAAYQRAGGDAFIAAEWAGWLYYLKGAYPEAEQSYATANRIHPGALNPVLGLLSVAQARKDEARILRVAQAVVAVDAANYRANMLLAAKAFASRDYRGAAFLYRKMVNLYPDDVDARSGLACGEYYTGDTHDALAQFQLILQTYPDYPFAKQGYQLAGRVNGRTTAAP
jgi:tetratricopeptide (TPR) repeat protein